MTEPGIEIAYSELKERMRNCLHGKMLEDALEFAEFLQKNEMIPSREDAQISYKGKVLCYMHLEASETEPAPWTIWTEGNYPEALDAVPLDDHMKEIARTNVNYCASCGGNCSPGRHTVIFGKEFENVCTAAMAFYRPNTEAVKCAEKMLEMRKQVISAMK